jgi:hypothetical protein
MKTLLQKLEATFADAALLEMGVNPDHVAAAVKLSWKEQLEENFVDIAFAEAADYDDIHKAILREHEDNDICFAH